MVYSYTSYYWNDEPHHRIGNVLDQYWDEWGCYLSLEQAVEDLA